MKVIYHSPLYGCMDGLAALWVAVQRYGDKVEPIPADYGDEPPNVEGEDVLVLDFSYNRETMVRMEKNAKSIFVVDHHETAQRGLAGLPFAVFDMYRSGAGLAWDHLIGHDRHLYPLLSDKQGTFSGRPWFIDYIEDRDLWRHELPFSEQINALIQSVPMKLEWLDFLYNTNWDEACRIGEFVLESRKRFIESTKKNFVLARLETDNDVVPCVNGSPFVFSDVLSQLAREHGVPFAVGWFQRADGRFKYSLRSREGGRNVAEIAERFGGGGHAGAAGFDTDRMVHIIPSGIPKE